MALAGNHPYSKFGVGDRESLWNRPIAQGRNPRDEVAAWWKKQYCPRRTIVAVVGREDLDTLASWVENSFSGMAVATEGLELSGPNGVHLFYDEPYGPEERGIALFIKPVKDERSLRLNITVPDADHLHEVKVSTTR
jgi:insulysin